MKHLILAALVSLVILSGCALAHQSGDEKKGSSMQDMMKQKQSVEGSTEGMGEMGMMKMMEQCNEMMKSAQHQGERAKENQKK
jgi:hypothetical protein